MAERARYPKERAEQRADGPLLQKRAPQDAVSRLLHFQRHAGNHAVQRLLCIQRFKCKEAFDFTEEGRAELPPSLRIKAVKSTKERHHIVSDAAILKFLGNKDENDPVPVNEWAKVALAAELTRARANLIEVRKTSDYLDDKTKRRDIDRAGAAVDQWYVPLHDKFQAASDENEPVLDSEEIRNLLCVLEWMPQNLVTGRKLRSQDPKTNVDIEALQKKGPAVRDQLIKIAVAMSQITDAQFSKVGAKFKDAAAQQEWNSKVTEWQKSKNADVSALFAALLRMEDVVSEAKLEKSTTGGKITLSQQQWEDLLVTTFYETSKSSG